MVRVLNCLRPAAWGRTKSSRAPHAPRQPGRVWLVGLILWLAIGALGWRLVHLQVGQAAALQAQARAQQSQRLSLLTPRRPIVDRRGQVLAVDEQVYALYAHPRLYAQPVVELAAALAPFLDLPLPELEAQLRAHRSSFELAPALSEGRATRLAALGLAGLELIPKLQRRYPNGDLAAAALGYVDLDHRAQAGLELSQDTRLRLPNQTVTAQQTGQGTWLSASLPPGFSHTDTSQLQLTLDLRWQRLAQTLLRQTVRQYHAKRGSLLLMDPRNGAIRVLASEPSYDPNRYYDSAVERFRTWAASDRLEPGSTFKPLNLAIALESGAIRPDDQFDDSGQIRIAGEPIENFDYALHPQPGRSSVTEILSRSSNVGMVRIMQRLSPEDYYAWLRWLGIEQPTGVDLPLDTPGRLKPAPDFFSQPIEPAAAAFGQGLELTPLKLLQLGATLANGGGLVVPHLVAGLRHANESDLYWQPDPAPPKQLFSPATSQTVLAMMTAVVDRGTGQSARLPGYRLAGKTGTAQKAAASGGYGQARVASFIGFLPADQPRLAVLVVIDEPQGEDAYGSAVAAPLAKAMLEQIVLLDD